MSLSLRRTPVRYLIRHSMRLYRERNDYCAALAELVRLKDGPRDEAYRTSKDAAWERARELLR